MYKIADIQDYRQPKPTTVAHWLTGLTEIIEGRYQDEESIQRLLMLISEHTELRNVSIALPDSPSRFKAQYCSTGVTNGVYSFAVQHALCRQFESREWLVIKDGSERPERFDPQACGLTLQDRCLLVPLVLRQSVLAVLVMDLRGARLDQVSLDLVHCLGAQIAQILATQVVPNFKTLYARPYQRVQEDELSDIHAAIDKCNGNKTMAAKVLGLTPRQLRYRLSKLSEENLQQLNVAEVTH
ncbi:MULTISPECIES: helix-turn-helix domain-containing protein [Oceanospirillaceae]|jgi:transcriptional regulator with GAF, ATPase, and Fis domain|uniref:Helix-turn-helix domain-containing protein n=1 Tax=Oceanobacter antarcticus TaxID=3133425 RepID=A0ABW8ND75_9GAMM|tara:strand:+ start:20280 stop:21002 length:723 start_codon:yes stop_codon:yes gene_type:complete